VSGTQKAGVRTAPKAGSGSGFGLSDGILLERFLADQDEEAFSMVVERHGPMVLAVCRSRLNDPWDIDDAFQSTFLKLVRSAKTIRRPELLGHWLYRVAHHCALRTGQNSAKHRLRSDLVAEVATVEPDGDLSLREIRHALFEEINQLGETYRAPVVLCYLEGMSHDEAARRLGWPLGTVKGRLSRARERLRERLIRRGMTLMAALLAMLSLEDLARADVPPELVEATIRAARRTTPKSPLPARLLALLSPKFVWSLPTALILVAAIFVGISTVAVNKVRARATWNAHIPVVEIEGGCHAATAPNAVAAQTGNPELPQTKVGGAQAAKTAETAQTLLKNTTVSATR
jgi:RNA polymerase sigma factor (sigma-70 family)